MKLKNKSQEGFTLIELMVVMFVIGILVSITYTSYTKSKDDGRFGTAKVEIDKIAEAISKFGLRADCSTATKTDLQNYGVKSENVYGLSWTISATSTAITVTYPVGGSSIATDGAALSKHAGTISLMSSSSFASPNVTFDVSCK